MVNLRSKSKAKPATPNAPLEVTDPAPPTVLDNSNLDEAALRKLPRVALQKLAMVHKVKANMKSELIIQQLLGFQPREKKRPAEDNPEEEPLRKRFKSEATFREVPMLSKAQDKAEPPPTGPTTDIPPQPSFEDSQPPEAGPSAPRSTYSAQNKPTEPSYDRELFSATESEVTEEEQINYGTPVSSRAGTPPPANVNDLKHCVQVMQQVVAEDVALLKEVAEMRDIAAKLRKRARDVRDLVKAEKGRRERMEAYFRYWQEIDPRWNREWVYGERMAPDYKTKPDDLDGPADPPTHREDTQEAENSNEQRRKQPTMRKPALSPEELRRMREEIVSKQEAEQRELEALRTNGGFFRYGPHVRAESPHDLGEDSSSIVEPAPVDDNVGEPLLIALENSDEAGISTIS